MNYADQLQAKPYELYSSTVGIISSIAASGFYTAEEKVEQIQKAIEVLEGIEKGPALTGTEEINTLDDNTIWDLETILRQEG